MKHTPEPWMYGAELVSARHAVGVCEEICRCSVTRLPAHKNVRPYDEGIANAARIVQCVNACAGMEFPEAEIPRLKTQEQVAQDCVQTILLQASEIIKLRGVIDEMKTRREPVPAQKA